MCIRDRYQRRVHGIMLKSFILAISFLFLTLASASWSAPVTIYQTVSPTSKFLLWSIFYDSVSNVTHLFFVDQQKRTSNYLSVSKNGTILHSFYVCLLYTSPSPRDLSTSRMPSSA
eukprot:TRINITY_DN14339_c0_g1_i1.p2 TRINITY_DN14339_c0_g1~~TRINITY_DN14339_c0_g1_i1.p2  ORF type:complete len:116 (+),score=42.42 TRINITY_DN14339_c0_g1_i1:64-411(+)